MTLVLNPRQLLSGNKKIPMRRALTVLLFVFLSNALFAFQVQHIKHKVLDGESVESIAKKYKVTPYDIFKLNPDLKKGLQPNMMLVIAVKNTSKKSEQTNITTSQEPRKPYGFIRYKVKRKDTLFGLAKEFGVTEEEIKKYNPQLYSEGLKRRMVLQIPKYRTPIVTETLIDTLNFTTYTVQPKETRWSIANKFGISVDSLHALNPKMQEIIDIGEQLYVPKAKKIVLDSISVKAFKDYVVPPKQTMFSLTKELGVSEQELMALNPSLRELGLQSGMVLKVPNKEVQQKLINAENYVFYEVKPKEGYFRLKLKLNATKEELQEWNPELKEKGLIAGMVLKIPKAKALGLDVKNSVVVEKFNLLDSINVSNRSKIAFVLPFRVNSIDFSTPESVAEKLKKDNAVKYATDFYSGALIALDSVQKLGLFVDVKTFDSEASRQKIRDIVQQNSFLGTKAVIGPIYPDAFNEMAQQLKPYNIPVLSPLTNSKINLQENVFLTVPTEESLRDLMIGYIKKVRDSSNLIVITDTEHAHVQNKILNVFPDAKVLTPSENLFIKTEDIEPLLSNTNQNWVIVEIASESLLANVTSVLNSVNSLEDYTIKLFTTNKTKAFDSESISNSYLSNLNFHFPQTDGIAPKNNLFVKQYKKRFKTEPNRYATRGFDITFDVLLRLAYKPNFFDVVRKVGETEYVENKFSYNKQFFSGYYNNSGHILKYENMEIKEVNIAN